MIVHMTMPEGRRFVCGELTRFAAFRRAGLTSGQAAAELGTTPEAGDLYEDTLRQLLQLAANTIDPDEGLEAIQARAVPSPNGCRYCGLEEREHFQRWTDGAGWHGWTEPTDGQRLARMLARRAQKSETAPAGTGAASDDNEGNPL